jgi:cytochrome c
VAGGGEPGLDTREIVALIAYMQRLGRDIQGAQPLAANAASPVRSSRPAAAVPGGRP